MKLTKEQREEYIKALSQDTPPWAYNCKDFIPGKTPVYYSGPYFDEKEIEATLKTILTGKWLVTGEEVAKFQRKFAKKFGVNYSHMVNSGSSANLVMIAALKNYFSWDEHSEIIVSPVGFPTTIAPIIQNGMKPVFVDIEMETLNFDLLKMESKINPNTKAIFVSPVLGNPPDMDKLYRLAGKHNLELIGDNCDSLGSKWGDQYITDYYTAWSTSFYPAHHISTGEGGMVSSDIEEIVDLAREFSWWGRSCRCVGSANLLSCGSCGKRFDTWLGEEHGIVDHKYIFSQMGYNLKPLDFQGAIGSIQLDKFDEIHARRVNSYYTIRNMIRELVPQAEVIDNLPKGFPSWFGVPILCDTEETKTRLQNHLEQNKIQTRNYFSGNILIHPGYKHLDDYKNYPNANVVFGRVFFLGAAPHYNTPVFDYIREVLEKWT
jgi:CDP-4-dehydro-6-deoxyglucose reductase, E1